MMANAKPLTSAAIAPRSRRSLRARLRVRETGCTGWGEPMSALRRRGPIPPCRTLKSWI